MFTDLIEIAVAVGGVGLVAWSVKQARAKGWSGSLQMAAAGFLLMGASAIGVVEFLVGIVLSPLAWLGVIALGIAGVLFVVGQGLEGRGKGRPAVESDESEPRGAVESGKGKADSATDDDLAEIEEILRRRGIE